MSSTFVYETVNAYGGAKAFFSNVYFTSVYPFGFVKDGKNLNYYDIPALQKALEKDIVEKISILGEGGGYMISPAHIIQNDVSPERVLKFIGLCKKHGKYE